MDSLQHFKLGFLAGSAEQGFTAGQAMHLLEKFALEKNANLFDWVPGPPSLGTMATLGALPLVAGGAAMYGANQLGAAAGGGVRAQQLAKPIDTKQTQKQELIAAYKAHTQQILADLKKQQADPVASDMRAQQLY